MRLTQLNIQNFRNIEQATLVFPAEGVALIGENGQGKTNLLEAIYYLQILRSMRGARDQELIRFDAPAFYLSARTVDHAQPHEFVAAFERRSKKKKIVRDGAVPSRLSDAIGALPAVVISPRDTELVTGAPSERRRYLDVLLSLTSRPYLNALQAYRNALTRRNAAMRDIATRNTTRSDRFEESVACWEPTLAEHGAILMAARAQWIENNAAAFATLCASIGENASVKMKYTCSIDTPFDAEQPLLDALARKRQFDMKRGITHVGPHRDEVALTLGGRDIRTFGSAGQQRTTAIALRMLEAATLQEHHGSPPLLLLDDPFAELDLRRSMHILELLRQRGIGQTILAVPRATDIPSELSSLPRWHIAGGVIDPADAIP